MFLLPVIIIPYESLFLKMRNRHSLLKVLNPYSLTKRNTLCLSIIPKIPKIPLYPPSPKISFFLLWTKIPKSLTTCIFSKTSPCSVNKISKIPHYLHLLQNFISFLNFPSPSSLKFYFPAARDLFIWVLSFFHPQLLLPLLKEIFFPSSLRSAIFIGIAPSLSSFLIYLYGYFLLLTLSCCSLLSGFFFCP